MPGPRLVRQRSFSSDETADSNAKALRAYSRLNLSWNDVFDTLSSRSRFFTLFCFIHPEHMQILKFRRLTKEQTTLAAAYTATRLPPPTAPSLWMSLDDVACENACGLMPVSRIQRNLASSSSSSCAEHGLSLTSSGAQWADGLGWARPGLGEFKVLAVV